MIEVKVVLAPAGDAPAGIPLPDGELDLGRNHSVVIQILWGVAQLCVGVVNQFKSELEDLARSDLFSPRVDEPEHTVEAPDVWLDLLVDADEFGLIAFVPMTMGRATFGPVFQSSKAGGASCARIRVTARPSKRKSAIHPSAIGTGMPPFPLK